MVTNEIVLNREFIALFMVLSILFPMGFGNETIAQRLPSVTIPTVPFIPEIVFHNTTNTTTPETTTDFLLVRNGFENSLSKTANQISNENIAAKLGLETQALTTQQQLDDYETVKQSKQSLASTTTGFENAEEAKVITTNLLSLFKPCVTVPGEKVPDFTIYMIKGKAALGQIENYVNGDNKIAFNLISDLKLYEGTTYLTDIQLLHTDNPYLTGKIIFGEDAEIRDVDLDIQTIDTLCRYVTAIEDTINIDTNQKGLKFPDTSTLDPISAKCATNSDYSIFRTSGSSPGLSNARIYDKGEVTIYILVNNKPNQPEYASPLEIGSDKRLMAAKLVINEFDDNEKDFNYYVDNIDTSCHKVNYVGTHMDISSKDQNIDPMRFFQ